jgi:hypothetical protein
MRKGDCTRRMPFLRRHPLASALVSSLALEMLLTGAPVAARAQGDTVVPIQNCDDAGPGSLRDTVAHALSGDRIVLPPDLGCNTIALTSGAIVVANDAAGQPFASLEIVGNREQGEFTIDGGGLDRVFVHDAGADALLTLGGVKITNGRTDGDGGCVHVAGNVHLAEVEISGCKAGVVTGDTFLGASVRGGGLFAGNTARLGHSTIEANKLYGGSADAYGGGVFALTAVDAIATTIDGNTIDTDAAAYGAGVAVGDPAAGIQGLVTLAALVTNNTATSHCGYCGARGGGVFAYGSVTVISGEFSGNQAVNDYGYGAGGGLYFDNHGGGAPVTATIAYAHFHCNGADTGGGVVAGGDLVVSDTTFDCNFATNDGGGIELLGSNLTMSGTSLVGNLAAGRGGAIFMFGYGDIGITNSTISGNVAEDGGAIGNTYGTVHAANATIANNQAFAHGGGIYFRYPYYAIDFESTIVAGNFSGSGTTVPEDIWPPGMTVTGSHNLVVAAPGVALPSDTLAADPLLQILTMNGGSTLTQALGDGSPAIDAGSNPLALSFDQRGSGFVREYGGAPEIGAYEAQPNGPLERIFADGFDP